MADKATEKAKGEITADAELKAINVIIKALVALEDEGRIRVLTYVNDRFGPKAAGG